MPNKAFHLQLRQWSLSLICSLINRTLGCSRIGFAATPQFPIIQSIFMLCNRFSLYLSHKFLRLFFNFSKWNDEKKKKTSKQETFQSFIRCWCGFFSLHILVIISIYGFSVENDVVCGILFDRNQIKCEQIDVVIKMHYAANNIFCSSDKILMWHTEWKRFRWKRMQKPTKNDELLASRGMKSTNVWH